MLGLTASLLLLCAPQARALRDERVLKLVAQRSALNLTNAVKTEEDESEEETNSFLATLSEGERSYFETPGTVHHAGFNPVLYNGATSERWAHFLSKQSESRKVASKTQAQRPASPAVSGPPPGVLGRRALGVTFRSLMSCGTRDCCAQQCLRASECTAWEFVTDSSSENYKFCFLKKRPDGSDAGPATPLSKTLVPAEGFAAGVIPGRGSVSVATKPLPEPTARPWFCVASKTLNTVRGPFETLADAKRVLNTNIGRPFSVQMICEMNEQGPKVDPRVVGGQRQADRLDAGFESWWSGWQDIKIMNQMCRSDAFCARNREGRFVRVEPTYAPTRYPTQYTFEPTREPTDAPTRAPTDAPSPSPTRRPTPPSRAPTRAPTRPPWFCVANLMTRAVSGPFFLRENAVKELNRRAGGSTNPQMLCEMTEAGPRADPARVGAVFASPTAASVNNTAAFGEQAWWANAKQVAAMNELCRNSRSCMQRKPTMRPTPAPSPAPTRRPTAAPTRGPWFCVARMDANTVTGPFVTLAEAKNELGSQKGSQQNRQLICEMDGYGPKVDPRVVGGQRQAAGPAAGFARFWTGDTDIAIMNSMCQLSVPCSRNAPTRQPTPVRSSASNSSFATKASPKSQLEARPWFCVARLESKSVAGPFETLAQAKNVLNRVEGSRDRPQMVCEMSARGAKENPAVVGGENQGAGLVAGFGKWWKGWQDIKAMNKLCLAHAECATGNNMKPAPSMASSSATTTKKAQPKHKKVRRRRKKLPQSGELGHARYACGDDGECDFSKNRHICMHIFRNGSQTGLPLDFWNATGQQKKRVAWLKRSERFEKPSWCVSLKEAYQYTCQGGVESRPCDCKLYDCLGTDVCYFDAYMLTRSGYPASQPYVQRCFRTCCSSEVRRCHALFLLQGTGDQLDEDGSLVENI